MKIVFIEKDIDIMGGVERIVNILANEFIKNYDVTVVSEHKNKFNPFFKYNDKIKIHYIQDRVEFNKKKKDMNPILLKVNKIINSFKDYYICNLLNEEIYNCIVNADCIVFGRINTALNFLPLLKKIKNKKIIVRDAIHLDLYKYYDKIRIKKYFPNVVNTLIVSSEESIQTYEDFFCGKSPDILKIYNPLGISPKEGFNFNKKTVISIGRMDKQKGFENLIKAFEKVHNNHNDWKLELYGDGNYKKNLEDEIHKMGASDYIKILPATKNVVKIFNNSSIFVLPSRYEGYANILVEAMACGMPCISYDWLMGVEEIITHNLNGIIVNLHDRKRYFLGKQDKYDIEKLSKQIKYLIENKKICEKFGHEANKIISTRSISTIINQWERIIKEN